MKLVLSIIAVFVLLQTFKITGHGLHIAFHPEASFSVMMIAIVGLYYLNVYAGRICQIAWQQFNEK